MLSKSGSARMPSAGPSFGAKFAGQVETIRSIAGSCCHCTRSATASPATRRRARRPCRRPRRAMPGTLIERVWRERAGAGASCPRRRFAITARGEIHPHPRLRRHRADRVDAGERLANDAARERRCRLVRLARAHGDRRQAQAAAVDEALARHVVDQELADRLLRAVRRLRRERRVVGHRVGQRAAEHGERAREHELRRRGERDGSVRAGAASRRG